MAFTFSIFYEFISVTGNHHIDNFIMKQKIERTVLKLNNPEGKISYITKSAEPLFDLEYNQDIAEAINTISLRKVKTKKIWHGLHYNSTRNVFEIDLKRKALGELIIIEKR